MNAILLGRLWNSSHWEFSSRHDDGSVIVDFPIIVQSGISINVGRGDKLNELDVTFLNKAKLAYHKLNQVFCSLHVCADYSIRNPRRRIREISIGNPDFGPLLYIFLPHGVQSVDRPNNEEPEHVNYLSLLPVTNISRTCHFTPDK